MRKKRSELAISDHFFFGFSRLYPGLGYSLNTLLRVNCHKEDGPLVLRRGGCLCFPSAFLEVIPTCSLSSLFTVWAV